MWETLNGWPVPIGESHVEVLPQRSPFAQPPTDVPLSDASGGSQELCRMENSLTLEPSRWQAVALGLQLKLVALWVLLTAPLAGLIAGLLSWYLLGASGVTPADTLLISWYLLGAIGGMVGVALLIDIAGRFCCLASPLKRRWPIVASAAAQIAGLGAAVTFVVGMIGVNLDLGLVVASVILVPCQLLAAFLFTEHLSDLAHELGQPQLADRARRIKSGLLRNISAGSGVLFVTLVLAFFTCLLGWVPYLLIIVLPLDAAILLPLLVLWLGVAVQMFGEYGQVLSQIRRLILAGPASLEEKPASERTEESGV
jgi:hypothetical protein